MGKHTAQYGIEIAVENMLPVCQVGEHPAKIMRIVELADEPNVGICLDSGHAHCSGHNVAEAVQMAGQKLFETHFHDNIGPVESPDPHAGDMHIPPGLRTINWLDVIKAHKEIDFNRPVTLEGGGFLGGLDGFTRFVDITIANWRTLEELYEKIKEKQ